jgi:phage-related protein
MSEINVVFYREADGSVPIRLYLSSLPVKAEDKCVRMIERLKILGREIRRPEADYLRDHIYELRTQLRGVQYRLLYFFYGTEVDDTLTAVISHGIIKEKRVPPKEIEQAIARRRTFLDNPQRHTEEIEI